MWGLVFAAELLQDHFLAGFGGTSDAFEHAIEMKSVWREKDELVYAFYGLTSAERDLVDERARR